MSEQDIPQYLQNAVEAELEERLREADEWIRDELRARQEENNRHATIPPPIPRPGPMIRIQYSTYGGLTKRVAAKRNGVSTVLTKAAVEDGQYAKRSRRMRRHLRSCWSR